MIAPQVIFPASDKPIGTACLGEATFLTLLLFNLPSLNSCINSRTFSREKIAQGFSCGKSARYIPAKRKRTALKTTNNRCAYPNCHKPYELFHHPERYSLTKNHENIVPLCKEHHEFAHNGLMENRNKTLQLIDEKYQSMRQLAHM